MLSINRVILLGNLGKDPEVRHLDGGVTVVNFPLATSETFKDKNGQKTEHTEWHNIVLWKSLAETAEKYLKKGSEAYIEGRIKTRSWEDKDGNKRYNTEIVADTLKLGRSPKDSAAQASSSHTVTATATETPTTPPTAGNTTDDLPF